ncbi:MAG: two-component regulator propeller domain-containing protein, partial [Bacteroidota bacterium]
NVFHRFLHDPEDAQSITNNLVTVLYPEGDSVLWVGTSYGLNRLRMLDVQKGLPNFEINRFLVDSSEIRRAGLSPNYISEIMMDRTGKLWVGTAKGLYRFDFKTDPDGLQPRYYSAENKEAGDLHAWQITALEEDDQGNIWVGTYVGPHRLKPDGSGFDGPKSVIADSEEAMKYEILHLEHRSDEDFLITTYAGIYQAQILENGQLEIEDVSPVPSEISGWAFINTFTDPLNNDLLWIGTEASGFLKTFRSPAQFQSNDLSAARPLGLFSPSVFGLVKDVDQVVWMGTYNGLLAYDRPKESYHYLRRQKKQLNKGLRSNRIIDLFYDSKDQLWVSTSTGLHRLENYDGTSSTFQFFGDNKALRDRGVYGISEYPDGTFVYGTFTGVGVFHPDKDKVQPEPIVLDSLGLTLRGYRVMCVQNDEKDNLWIGSSNGLYRLKKIKDPAVDIQKAEVETFRYNERDTNSLRNDFIADLHLDSKKRLWAGTFNGFIRILEKEDKVKFKSYAEEDGLSNNVIYEIVEDPATGYLWLSTNRGLSCFDPDTETFQ